MIFSILLTLVVSTLIVASIGYSYTQRDVNSLISLEEDTMNPLYVYVIHPCIYLWCLVTEVFTWAKIGIMMFLSSEFRNEIIEEGTYISDVEEEENVDK